MSDQEFTASNLPEIVEALQSSNRPARLDALRRLKRIQPISDARLALPVVVSIMQDDAYSLRRQAIEILGMLPDTEQASAALYAAIEDKDQEVRSIAARSLLIKKENLPQLAAALGSPFREVRREVSRGIQMAFKQRQQGYSVTDERYASANGWLALKIDSVVDFLIPAISSPDEFVKRDVADTLRCIADDARPATPHLIKQLVDEKDGLTSSTIAKTVLVIGGVSEGDLKDLATTMRNSTDRSTRQVCAEIIGFQGETASSVVPDLVLALENERDPWVRGYIAKALGQIGRASASSIPALINMYKDRSVASSRTEAVEALGRIAEPSDQVAIEALLGAIDDRNTSVQLAAVIAFRRFEPSAEIIAALKKVRFIRRHEERDLTWFQLQHRDGAPVEKELRTTLKVLGASDEEIEASVKPSEEPALADDLTDGDSSVQVSALQRLYHIPEVDASLLPALTATLTDPDHVVRYLGVQQIARLGPKAKSALPQLVEMLNGNDVDTSGLAAKAISIICDGDPELVTILSDRLMADDYFKSGQAASALANLGKVGLPSLLAGLETDKTWTIFFSANGIARLGKDAVEARPLLKRLLAERKDLAHPLASCGFPSLGDAINGALASIGPDSGGSGNDNPDKGPADNPDKGTPTTGVKPPAAPPKEEDPKKKATQVLMGRLVRKKTE